MLFVTMTTTQAPNRLTFDSLIRASYAESHHRIKYNAIREVKDIKTQIGSLDYDKHPVGSCFFCCLFCLLLLFLGSYTSSGAHFKISHLNTQQIIKVVFLKKHQSP